ncbi:nicotinamide mononucleotide transporter family protein [Actinokineospora globicatena]|uniref:nicotinamide mononucleotide transporter family protein n=1 Tax=Actinokineospora globicatena TaxID=103729 RepID=UPI0020A3579C|nr:nicotinamide mononucleotide transporter family protein [Actinokineospora globicatena]MCP2305380.1 nicotinamide mononucleotide transporter [Actinokineospora globicatena]GLW80857.1 nicotinamide mononucleotide transporter [Actinokineospora globicatena]GLW87684.1 nicotinamide mononucleotide transporter [Actinokineospora globicatena]
MGVLLESSVTVFGQRIALAELFGQFFALAVVFLAQRRSMLTWPVQLASVVLLFSVYASAHLGGLAVRQVVVGVIAVYGWWAWARRRDPVFGVAVRRATGRELLVTALAFVAGTAAFASVLDALDASWAPWPDAAIFVGTVLAFALQAWGLVEFWLVWLVVDAIGVPLQLRGGLWFSAIVYTVFAGLVVHGWISWYRSAKRQVPATV